MTTVWQWSRARAWLVAAMGLYVALLVAPAMAGQALAPATESQLTAGGLQEEELATFYSSRAYHAVWQSPQRVEALADAVAGLQDDGLTPGDYLPEGLAERQATLGDDEAARVRFELDATRGLLLAMRHLARGKTDPRRLEKDWSIPLASYSPDWARLSQQLDAGDIDAAFEQVRPEASFYQALREGLSHYRRVAASGGWPKLPERSESLREGDRHPDVALLRQRLAVERDPASLPADADYYPQVELAAEAQGSGDAERFDAELAREVRFFQRRHLLEPDAVVGRHTRQALNVPVEARIDQLRVNLERARWLLHDLPASYVLVDIAGYELHHVRESGEDWRTRIVVGQPYRETPSIRSSITHLTFNPTWTIPPTIFREDKLPRIRDDLGYLEEANLRVLAPSGEELDPAEVDWDNPGGVMLRQAAGGDNPLGDLVIRFPNDHAIYLHDTPAQGLFNRAQRAASSGCIRVEYVEELARQLLGDSQRWSAGDISERIDAGRTGNVSLASQVPVILSYWTAGPDEYGGIAFRPDIYGRDVAVRRALDAPAG
ncbi:Murein L,D-transpeptidase YcbB/YkuD [Franzmannia pantelleriensis]|uniref:Murein L,D-transpeptidase YcbB/YkuD n=1 Tax=Franzmannia pantelleriensis TaxID=48727 RepID=A0A1G9R5C2_9GAMM|nr:L,D-transpeptidase family protein [Halomonas pantelleriensis]SDM18438.1 Murein L,D-transpeptidase YcbB/YkuD [Halomonas pantelleriensis]